MNPVPVHPLPRTDLDEILERTAPLWEEARGAEFFITGGTGFFGLWLLESFVHINERLNLGARATVLSRDPAAFARKAPHLANRPELHYIAGDIRDFPFPEKPCAYVIHAATETRATTSDEAHRDIFETIVQGTRRVLDFAAHAKTRKLLFTSSGAVYGRQPPQLALIPEDYPGAPDPLRPISGYGEGKRVSEYLCTTSAPGGGYEAKIARCFAFVGPHLPLDSHFAISNFIESALRRKPFVIHGDGTPLRSYLYTSDLATWLWTLLFRGPAQQAVNVGSDEVICISDLARSIARATDHPGPIQILRTPQVGLPVERYTPSLARARTLGLTVSVPLEEAISRTLRYITSPSRSS